MKNLDKEIETLSAEYKNFLKKAYIYANMYANDRFDTENIDLLKRLDKEAKHSLFRYTEKRIRQRRITSAYTMFIIIICYIVSTSFILFDIPHKEIIQIAILISIFGSISILALALTLIPFKTKKVHSALCRYDLIQTWNELELITKELANIKDNGQFISPTRYLTEIGILTPDEKGEIQHLLSLRNNIVHSTEGNIPEQEIIETTKSAKRIIAHLRNL